MDWRRGELLYNYLADGDLDEVMDEQEVVQALAAYNDTDTRQALKDLRLARATFPARAKARSTPFRRARAKASAGCM